MCFDEQEGNHEACVHAPGKYINLSWKLLQLKLLSSMSVPNAATPHCHKPFDFVGPTSIDANINATGDELTVECVSTGRRNTFGKLGDRWVDAKASS